MLPFVPEWAHPVWHLFVVRSPKRDELQAELAMAGVESLIHNPIPPDRQKAHQNLGMAPGTFPIAERLATEVPSLPIGPHFQVLGAKHVSDAVSNFFR